MSDDNVIQFRPKTIQFPEADFEVFTVSLSNNSQIQINMMQEETPSHEDFDWIISNLDVVKEMVEAVRKEIMGNDNVTS